MGFQQGLSGLNAAARSLDVTGNNVANASTVGFKQSRAEFADIYAASLNNSGATPIGLGAKVTAVTQQFTQGGITVTNLPLDLAINGGGFFRLSDNGVTSYTRNGQFQLDKNGYIVNAQGLRLQGYAANTAGTILNTAVPTDLRLFTPSTTSDITPKITGDSTIVGGSGGVDAVVNLDSRESVIAAAFSATDPTTYNRATALSVYDSLGNAQTMQYFFKKTASNTWDVYASVTNPAGTRTDLGVVRTLDFDTDGTLVAADEVAFQLPAITAAQLGTGAAALTISTNFTGTTQYGSNFKVNSLSQDGYTSGSLAGYSVGDDGIIVGRYTNGITKNLAQVTLDSFRNPQGLDPVGNNNWVETSESGPAITSEPGTDANHGPIQSAAVEDSNIDLTQELVNMIITQRVYQANAQTIKVQDTILQTLVSMR